VLSDAVYSGILGGTGIAAATGLNLTTAWNLNAAYEHFWNPRWRTSMYGGYAAVTYSSDANNQLCNFYSVGFSGCKMNWNTWWLGSRTQWNVTKDFYMGLDVLYQHMESANNGFFPLIDAYTALSNSVSSLPPVTDLDNWMFRFRVHRDFYP
jgi:hypothetical protein